MLNLVKKFFYCIFIFDFIALANEPLCISLGSSCNPAHMLRDLGIRKEAYPFDWVISSHTALYNCILDDFSHFLTDLKITMQNFGLVDYYGLIFIHDFPNLNTNNSTDFSNYDVISEAPIKDFWPEKIPEVTEKYKRRIERFKEACLSGKEIFFVREIVAPEGECLNA